jgi:hypothetical protein
MLRKKVRISAMALLRLVELTGCRQEWLFFGAGPMFVGAARIAEQPAAYQATKRFSIPVCGHVAANDSQGRLVVEALRGDMAPYDWPAGRLLLEVVGQSLAPIAWPGQRVVLDTDDCACRAGDLVVVHSRTHGLLAKRLTRQDAATWTLSAVNAALNEPDVVLDVTGDDMICCRVIVGVLFR